MKQPIPGILKRIGLAAVLTIMPALAFSQTKALILLTKDGSTYEFALKDVDRINFNAQTVEMLTVAGTGQSIAYSDIDRISFGSTQSGISDLVKGGNIAVYPSVTSGPLTIAGAEAGTDISVFDINGTLVSQTRATDSALTLDLSDAASGVMIVRIGNHTVKIIKK